MEVATCVRPQRPCSQVRSLVPTPPGARHCYGWSLPAVWDYVTFMKVQRTAYLRIRYDHLYAIYLLFAVAAMVRYLWILGAALRGRDPEPEPWRGEGEP